MKRHLVEALERRKDGMISALWSNSNYDDDKGTRRQAIEELEENFEEVVYKIMFDITEEEIDKENPFFAAAERGVQRIAAPRVDEGAAVKDVVGNDYTKYVDQP